MRGELDWIVMKALEKDRNRRYETASGLPRTLQRYLDRRAGGGLPAVGGVPVSQVRQAQPAGGTCRGCRCGRVGCGSRGTRY